MKILTIHSDRLEVELKDKAIKDVEKGETGKITEAENALVVFTAVEKGDKNDNETISESAVDEIEDIFNKVNAEEVVIYPYAHLSSNLSSPSTAKQILEEMSELLEKKDIPSKRVAFGWYKRFDLNCKGHPLSELSRELKLEESKGMKKEQIDDEKRKRLLKQISRSGLDTRKLEDNDHRILGQKMNLFSFNDAAPGMVFWHDKGLKIYNELVKYWREKHRKAGYEEISTPYILDEKLWKISGHWDKYKDNMFSTEYEGRDMGVKPMNCPGGILVYKSDSKSYRDLPLKVAELGTVHRKELSGVLSGLFRVNYFTQDDAHVYCSEDDLKDEIKNIMDLIDDIYSKFNLSYKVKLATRPEERMGDDEIWDKAEAALKEMLESNDIEYEIAEGEGVFYGPKLEYHIEDSMDRTWQCGTIQLDFNMPEKFDLEYTGQDNDKHRPLMLHRAILGSLERFIGILLEHTNGRLPVWLAPVQIRVLSLTDRNIEKSKEILENIREMGIRADSDFASATLSEKVRKAEVERVPYTVVVGDKEEENGTIAVRKAWKDDVEYGIDPKEFIKNISEKIKQRKWSEEEKGVMRNKD
ncbi:MAG: threonine--tRNA ligase [Candidatus Aenigmatarchaeota archaeon]